MGDMDDIIKEFLVESYENLDQLDRDFVALETDPTATDKLASIFRTIHTIKGTCGCLGLNKLERVAHVGENLLSRLRDGEFIIDAEITTGLLQLVDAIREILASIESTGQEGDKEYADLRALLTELNERPRGVPAEVEPKHADAVAAIADAVLGNDENAVDCVAALESVVAIEPAALAAAAPVADPAFAEKPADSLAGNAIRVDVGLLDKLMNLVGELVLARNQVVQHLATQKDATLGHTVQRLNLIMTELQEGVMKTRMQPIGNLWNKFPRIVRDVASACQKKVRIEMEGRETELDKTIIEAIKDPLTHVIRNSVDHGVESPEQRAAAGKSAEGLLLMRAFHESGQVIIEIVDDGKGINPAIVKRKAVERGLITDEKALSMSDREAVNLVFLPGFSTAEKISNVSGRGVGMDVVKTNIERIGGTVDIQSRIGQGTTLRLKIPLTLAIIPALIVKSAGERFAIPQASLLELVRIDEGKTGLEMINGTPLYRLRGNLLPLIHLDRELKLSNATTACATAGATIIVLRGGDRQFGLVVDEVDDTREIVVKPLAYPLKGLPVFAGATIMGDGLVSLILDVTGLAQRAHVLTQTAAPAAAEESVAADDGQRHALLLFRLAGGRRMAAMLSAVARLEEFSRSTVENAGGTLVVQYDGKIMPLINVAEMLGDRRARARASRVRKDRIDSETVAVIVHRFGDRNIGLCVEQIDDVIEQAVNVQLAAEQPGVMGTTVVKGKVTELLDVPAVVAAACARNEEASFAKEAA